MLICCIYIAYSDRMRRGPNEDNLKNLKSAYKSNKVEIDMLSLIKCIVLLILCCVVEVTIPLRTHIIINVLFRYTFLKQ